MAVFCFLMDIITFLVLSLAVWRVSSLVTKEDGPFEIFADIRAKGGELLNCLWCFSIWGGLVVFVAYAFWPVVVFWACLPLALSAAAIVVDRWCNG